MQIRALPNGALQDRAEVAGRFDRIWELALEIGDSGIT
jgi:hypothetical protein